MYNFEFFFVVFVFFCELYSSFSGGPWFFMELSTFNSWVVLKLSQFGYYLKWLIRKKWSVFYSSWCVPWTLRITTVGAEALLKGEKRIHVVTPFSQVNAGMNCFWILPKNPANAIWVVRKILWKITKRAFKENKGDVSMLHFLY